MHTYTSLREENENAVSLLEQIEVEIEQDRFRIKLSADGEGNFTLSNNYTNESISIEESEYVEVKKLVKDLDAMEKDRMTSLQIKRYINSELEKAGLEVNEYGLRNIHEELLEYQNFEGRPVKDQLHYIITQAIPNESHENYFDSENKFRGNFSDLKKDSSEDLYASVLKDLENAGHDLSKSKNESLSLGSKSKSQKNESGLTK